MLKTNSKKAKENIKKYIMDNFDGCNYGIDTPETFKETAEIILETFRNEYRNPWECAHHAEVASFESWAAGLPSIIDTCYYYNRSAVDDLGAILEETEAEKERFSESDAESLLSRLIYREIKNAK